MPADIAVKDEQSQKRTTDPHQYIKHIMVAVVHGHKPNTSHDQSKNNINDPIQPVFDPVIQYNNGV